MREGPDISRIASLIGDPSRANMLISLLSGKALTSAELAKEAGITPQTASSHLAKLEQAALLRLRKQGRCRYYCLSDDVVPVLEGIMGLAENRGHTRVRTGPKDKALRRARVCYDHLAGEYGVRMLDSMKAQSLIIEHHDVLELTDEGQGFIAQFGIDVSKKNRKQRPLCLSCLDWSERRSHLAGFLGAQFMTLFLRKGWVKTEDDSRVILLTSPGVEVFNKVFYT